MKSNQFLLKLMMGFGFLGLSVSEAIASEIIVHVNGMVCAFCAQGVTNKLKNEKEVQDVKVDLKNKKVTVFLKDKSDLADAKLKELISDAGYNVEKIERNAN